MTTPKKNLNLAAAPAVTPIPASPATPPNTPSPQPPPPTPATVAPTVTGVANGSNHATKVDLQALYQAVISGLLAFYAPTDTFLMKSGTYTRDDLVLKFQAFVASLETTKNSNRQWRQDIQAERALELEVTPLRVGVRAVAQTRFGKDGTQLIQFGFQPAKVRVQTPASKVLAAAKAKATREARGTLTKKEKAALQGTVTTVTVGKPAPQAGGGATAPLPSTAPAAGSAPVAPAAPAATAPAAATPAVAAPVAPVTSATQPQH